MKKAYFAGGCFWCIEAPLAMTKGVTSVLSGYAGGEEQNPTYYAVKSQSTHHRESIEVTYDPQVLDYEGLVKVFLSHIDPLDGEGQFGDVGRSYTTAVYYQDQEEKEIAARLLRELQTRYDEPLQVALEPMGKFWVAEEEHLHYYQTHPEEWAEEMRRSGRGAIHEMSLQPAPFAAIARGAKRVEMRLNDPKRQAVEVGDKIVFRREATGDTVCCLVTGKRVFPDFAALYAAYPATELGYTEGDRADYKDMNAYYTEDKIATFGVCALEIAPADK